MGGVETKSYAETVVLCVLNGMKKGSLQAKRLFPRLLSLLENHYDDVSESFIENVRLRNGQILNSVSRTVSGYYVL